MVDKLEKPSQDQPRLKRLLEIESEMLAQFKDKDIYKVDAPENYNHLSHEEKNKGKYFATFPYPYMNGYLHLGHGFTMTKAEIQTRFQRQLGKRVLFPFGFHCTGMPIQAAANRLKREITSGNTTSQAITPEELKKNPKATRVYTQYEIMKQLGFTDEHIPKFQDPWYWFDVFPEQGRKDMQDFGIFTDWRRSFFTTKKNPYYDSFIRWQFTHLKELAKITYAKRYTIFSALDGQPCADHDRSKGEGVGPQEYVCIKIQLVDIPEQFAEHQDKKIFLVAATLRPETMYGQTNCYVLPEGQYGLYEMKSGELFVMSERAAKNMAYQELTKEDTKYPSLASITGQQLIGKRLKSPLTSYEYVYALPLTTISMVKGTGIVTSVPSDSPDDYAMLKDLQTKKGLREKYNVEESWCVPFEPIPIIEIPGLGNLAAQKCYDDLKIQSHKDADKLKQAKEMCYLEGFYKGIMMVGPCAGKRVEEAKPIIKEMMIQEGMAVLYHEPEGEVVSRSGDQCVVALKFQWLLNYGEEQWKNAVKSHVFGPNFNTFTPKTRQEFEVILEWLKEWGCSRTAGLGTNLPWDDSFIVESLSDSTIYMAYYTVAHLLQGGVLDGSQTGPLGVKPEHLTRAAWDYVYLGKEYNQAECPNITEDQLKKMRHEFEYWYPMDLRVSAKDLIRNHLTMSLYNHAAIWKDNLDQRMCRAYFCNGYLMLNNEKMSKSTGNFMTLKECINFYGIDASRIALADAGDSLDDANFDEKVANAAILRLYTLEEWIKNHCPKSVDFASQSTSTDPLSWDRIMDNELNRITAIVDKAYHDLKYKLVIKHGLNELSSLKEAYLIATGGNPNPVILFRYLKTLLVLLNPIIPHFCQYQWQHVLVPALKASQNVTEPITELLLDQKWPYTQASEELRLTQLLNYLHDIKSAIRLSQAKAQQGGKKGKKPASEPVEEKALDKCILYFSTEFPEYKRRTLEILSSYEFVDNQVKGDYVSQLRNEFKGKESKDALMFAAFVVKEAQERGKSAFELVLPFNEEQVLTQNRAFLFENMPTIKTVEVHHQSSGAIVGTETVRASATPGKPTAHFC